MKSLLKRKKKTIAKASRIESLFEIFNCLYLFPRELNVLIMEYEQNHYDEKPIRTFKTDPKHVWPLGMASNGIHLYVCLFTYYGSSHVRGYPITVSSKQQNFFTGFSQVSDLDFYDNRLYIIDRVNLRIFDLENEKIIFSFLLPQKKKRESSNHLKVFLLSETLNYETCNHLKVDHHFIYITIDGYHQVFLYSRDGILQSTLGTVEFGTEPSRFSIT